MNNWQTIPDSIKSEPVQYWHNGVMVTARLSKKEAQKLIIDGKAFAMTDCAIGALIDGKKES